MVMSLCDCPMYENFTPFPGLMWINDGYCCGQIPEHLKATLVYCETPRPLEVKQWQSHIGYSEGCTRITSTSFFYSSLVLNANCKGIFD
jgi:hypothetical protein